MSKAGLMSPTISSCNGVTTAPIRVLFLGYCFAPGAPQSSPSQLAPVEGDAGLHPRDHFEKMITALRCFLRRKRDWHPKPGRASFRTPARRTLRGMHADDGVALAIQRNCAADDAGSPPKRRFHSAVTQKHDVSRPVYLPPVQSAPEESRFTPNKSNRLAETRRPSSVRARRRRSD